MEKIIIITGHGQYASGILSSLTMLSGNTSNIKAIDFTSNDTNITLHNKFVEMLNANKDKYIVFVCDLLGGTPYKEASKIALNSSNISVITGVNLGGLIDTNLKLTLLDNEQITSNLKEASIKNILVLPTIVVNNGGTENGI